jgi:hypothetical protein
MTEEMLRKKCGLGPAECIKTNKGDVDILYIKDDIVTLRIVSTGEIFNEAVRITISKFGKRTEEDKQTTEAELRKKCGLGSNECINSNLGVLDILDVSNGTVSLGVLASDKIICESVSSVIKKLKNYKKKDGNTV